MKTILIAVFVAAAAAVMAPSTMVAAVPADQHWDSQFGPPGVNANAAGIAVVGNKIYTVGFFSAAGNTKALGVAGFDGTNWFPLNGGLQGGGIDPEGICAAADGNYLYVGGLFTNADDPTAIDTARWDGTNWSGTGIQGVIETARRNGNNLYFGGVFSGTTNLNSTNIIGWNGTNWFALGPGLGGNGFNIIGYVDAIAFSGNNLYAGGTFSYSGTSAMTNVAYWDGNAWHAMGNPFNGIVGALQFYGGYLYAGGGFTNTSLHFTNLARWDGSTWSAVPGGSANRAVSDFATDGTNLFVGGLFTQIGGVPGTNIVMFDGTNWTQLGGGLHFFQFGLAQANRLCWSSNQLYVAGDFDRAGDYVGADNVARWDGTNWWNLGGQTSKGMGRPLDFVQSMFLLTNAANSGAVPAGLYAGGLFPTAGSTNANCIAYFDGTNWNALGAGISGSFGSAARVYALTTDGTYLYAGGNFTNAGAYTGVGGVAAWDGSNWYPLSSGLDWVVNALAVDGYGALWVGGSFTNIANVGYAQGLAVWYGGSWYSSFGSVDGTNAVIYAIAYDGGSRIYVGGQFYSVGGVAATNIAYYDYSDGTWHPLGLGVNTRVSALAYGNGYLYAGGTFTQADSVAVNHVAQWDGSNWSALGSGISGLNSPSIVSDIAVSGNNVYFCGSFTNAGGIVASNIAVWNGSSWSALGSGTAGSTSATAYTVAAAGNDVYLGGQFTFAGDKPAQFIAHWNWQSNYYPAAHIQLTRAAWQTNGQFRFRVNGTGGQSYLIQATTNFTSWTSLQTNSMMFYDFSDTGSVGYPFRFYRVVLGP